MARTSENITATEIKIYHDFCAENNIVADESPAGLKNGNEIGTYVAITLAVDFAPENLKTALGVLRDRIVFYTPAQIEYRSAALENADAANKLNDWLEIQNILVKDGDTGFQNQTSILKELRGRSVTTDEIHRAIQRIQSSGQSKYSAGKRPLVFVPVQRKVDPRQQPTDPNHKPGQFITDANKSPRDHARERQEAAERANPTPAKPSGPVDAWETIARNHLGSGRTHGQRDSLKSVFDKEVSGEMSWRLVATEMGELKKSFNTLFSTARF